MYRVIKNPTLYEAEKLGDIEHSESFGNINDKRYIAKPPTDIPLLVLSEILEIIQFIQIILLA
ncbi:MULTISPECIES: hypothetical protein [unclassified Moorena]|uniref:hypothetical protein n=1 Tax=unclassified Moorena TaxID=2683338 RepID=UPI001400D05E|nr:MULTISPECIES: hypothetical protein [unclassified Moorena]NEO14471.1 hypothetical protein [Moorena sp. SIO3E8]NEQ03423.1 hypothetical protein [Moorena sp. SIO3F7]